MIYTGLSESQPCCFDSVAKRFLSVALDSSDARCYSCLDDDLPFRPYLAATKVPCSSGVDFSPCRPAPPRQTGDDGTEIRGRGFLQGRSSGAHTNSPKSGDMFQLTRDCAMRYAKWSSRAACKVNVKPSVDRLYGTRRLAKVFSIWQARSLCCLPSSQRAWNISALLYVLGLP